MIQTGRVQAFASAFILAELAANLASKAGWDAERIEALRKKLSSLMTIIEPVSHVDAIKSVDADNRILECAVDAEADVLVTGNMKDIRPLGEFQGIRILTPREFVEEYFPR